MDADRITELAALHALDVLEDAEAREARQLLATSDARFGAEFSAFQDIAEALAKSLPSQSPPPALKQKLLHVIEARQDADPRLALLQNLLPRLSGGFAFEHEAESRGWQPLPIPGAHFKLLSLDLQKQYAVGLGKLDPGARYPSHTHFGPEDIYMLSGDLHVGDEVLHAGDYHHAAAGTTHPDNFSEQGCTLLIVLSTKDLVAELSRI